MRILVLFFIVFSLLFIGRDSFSQSIVRVYGTVRDSLSGEMLPAATIWHQTTQTGAATNRSGHYSLNIIPGHTAFQVTFIGYQPKVVEVDLSKDTLINVQLSRGVELRELTVSAPSSEGVSTRMQTGLLQLPVKDIVWAPVFVGESNLIASLKTLPGVGFGKEGGSELYVRGGTHDQNLVLLDGAPVYNLNHAFGLLSVFNTSTLKNVNLYKGGIPARYGGRLSSVLDVSVREGNRQSYHGDFSLSTVAASLTAEGPIVKDKASFLFSLRRSWPDLLITGIFSQVRDGAIVPGLYFMDVNGKVNFSLKRNHHFFLSYYTGQDKLFVNIKEDGGKIETQQGWGNHLVSGRWNTVSSSGNFSEVSAHFSTFYEFEDNELFYDAGGQKTNRESGLKEFCLKGNTELSLSDNCQMAIGGEGYYRSIVLPKVSSQLNGSRSEKSGETVDQMGTSIFVSAVYSGKRFKFNLGLRGGMFGSRFADFTSIEPRLSANYFLNENFSFKAGVMYNSQSLYAMAKSANSFPGYTWIPLTEKLKPSNAWQLSTGFHWRKGASFHIDVEGYYKWLNNLAGNYLYSSLLFNSHQWEEMVNQGKGRAYGGELISEYIRKCWDVRLSYTIGKVESSFSSINGGEWFPYDYDIRHDLTLTGSCYLYNSKKRKGWLSGNFSLHSGCPVTLPSQSIKSMMPLIGAENYWFDFSSLDHYDHPNNQRMPTYHRLDLGFHMEKQKRKGTRTWSLGVINVYNRQNPYIHFRSTSGAFKQLVMFPVMPFVSFKRSF